MKSIRADFSTRPLCRGLLALLGAGIGLLIPCARAQAHAFGARYDLPLPLEFYLVGAGAAVALSFVIVARTMRRSRRDTAAPTVDLLAITPLRHALHPAVIATVQALSVGLLVLVLAAGLFGSQDPIRNIAPTFVWIIWWVGLAYTAALIGNLWPVINPWSIVSFGLVQLARRFGIRAPVRALLAYPPWLGVWPAVVLFAWFAWFELVGDGATQPASLALAALMYSAITWLGMAAFGRSVWLAHGEAFSLAFGVFGRFAPIGAPERTPEPGGVRHWPVRPYGSGLLVTEPCRLSKTAFVLTLLATVTFDGVKETPAWGELLQWLARTPALYRPVRALHDLGFDLAVALETLALLSFPALFLLVFLGFCWLSKRLAAVRQSTVEIAGFFVFSLVPIAIAYHLAHYLSYLLIAGQYIIPLASDPFGVGWDVFGTADYAIDIGLIGADVVWYAAVIVIVVGHVFAVAVAHKVARRIFATADAALRSQYPMLVLMVAYTMTSLWILAQPIVGGPDLSMLRARADTVSLAPFEFREYCLDLAGGEVIYYDFQAGRPLEFDIHYHDGLSIRFPVRSSGVTAQASQFVAPAGRTYCFLWFNKGLATTPLSYRLAGALP